MLLIIYIVAVLFFSFDCRSVIFRLIVAPLLI